MESRSGADRAADRRDVLTLLLCGNQLPACTQRICLARPLALAASPCRGPPHRCHSRAACAPERDVSRTASLARLVRVASKPGFASWRLGVRSGVGLDGAGPRSAQRWPHSVRRDGMHASHQSSSFLEEAGPGRVRSGPEARRRRAVPGESLADAAAGIGGAEARQRRSVVSGSWAPGKQQPSGQRPHRPSRA